jgi:hypothetical protein
VKGHHRRRVEVIGEGPGLPGHVQDGEVGAHTTVLVGTPGPRC